ncbi:MurR/RpiR family transcriptional regulator [Pseudohalocynthiibacter sp. F2068]|jgi:DNA-binding MurR/RpiR family transcriptional regulator|uniref:MurR/RpiR family transcriptional regulator n=1 Tax=Pseudohalocynthiibacter sp. F2068 TaxID=2926418 RepID=UPI001FF150FF|nr:MurR/RpiR family transcriptional regulator [Pseudohalocynthiibacter sp. F2068]MCK0104237.1 MurR/RpiR family transcriptional regulator [Pseudohalocynthiibacter sp. F2068]
MSDATSSPASPSLTQRIHKVYGELPNGERRAADKVLDMPGELAIWSASELAKQAKVSNATISRFVRRLGYQTYEEARRDARAMRAVGSPLYLAERPDLADKPGGLHEIVSTETSLLKSSYSLIDPSVLDDIAAHLAKARRVRFAGFRNSFVAAEYGRSLVAQFRTGVEMLNAPGQTLAEGIANVSAGDIVVIVGLRRRPADFEKFVKAVSATNADVALLSDPSIREAPAMARWNLTCLVETSQSLDSYAGAISVLRLLALASMKHLDAEARRHLEKIEAIHESLGELDR